MAVEVVSARVRNQSFVCRKVISAGLGKACLMARRQIPVPGVSLQVREFLAGPPEETKLQDTGPPLLAQGRGRHEGGDSGVQGGVRASTPPKTWKLAQVQSGPFGWEESSSSCAVRRADSASAPRSSSWWKRTERRWVLSSVTGHRLPKTAGAPAARKA